MANDSDRNRRRDTVTDLLLLDVSAIEPVLPGQETLADVAAALDAMTDGVRSDPATLERALDGVSIPDAGELDVETNVLTGGIDPGEVDLVLDEDGAVVEAGGQAVDTAGEAVEIAVDESGETATVVVDAGGEAVEVVAEVGGEAAASGGEMAAEAVVEVVAAALEV